jgi:hypothetical protein
LYEAQAPIVHQKFTRLKALTSVRRGHHQRDLVQRLQQTHAVDDSGSVNVKALEAKCRFFFALTCEKLSNILQVHDKK